MNVRRIITAKIAKTHNSFSVRLKIYDVTGRSGLKKLFKAVGYGKVEIPIVTKRLSSGVYFYQVELRDRKYLGKFSILR